MSKTNTDFAISTAHAYTTIAAPAQPGSVAATLGELLPVNFSGQTQNDTLSAFTVGGWMRAASPAIGEPDRVFNAPGQFSLEITPTGLLSCRFGPGDSGSTLTSQSGITDTEWHYVAVACQQTVEGASPQAEVQIALDGLVVAHETVETGASSLTNELCLIGSGALQFVSWTIWAVALPAHELFVPEFGPPPLHSVTAHDLVAAFNFANGTDVDESGNHVSITANKGPSFLPRLSLSNGSVLTPAPADGVTVFDNTFSWMGWVALPTGEESVTLLENDDASVAVSGIEEVSPTTTRYQLQLTLNAVFRSAVSMITQTGSYVHLTMTIEVENDHTQVWFYLNGVLKVGPSMGMGIPGGPARFALTSGAMSAIQGLSVWDRAVTMEEIQADISGADPTGAEGLQAYYALQHDLRNSVTGNEATTRNATLVDIVEDEQMSAQVAAALSASPRVQPDLLSPRIDFRAVNLLAIAADHGIDVTAPGDASALSDNDLAFLTWFENQLDGLPSVTADQARNDFLRNLRIGEELRTAGVKYGQMDVVVEGDHTVVYYYDHDGRHEAHRIEEILDPLTEWILKIIFDAIAIIASIFGLLTSKDQLRRVVTIIIAALPAIKNALLDGLDKGHANAAEAIFAVAKEILSAGLLLTVIKGLVSGSWWSLIFTALSLLGQIIAIILSGPAGPALIGARLALVGVHVAQLIYDLSQYPSHPAPAASEISVLPPGSLDFSC